ncbi:MAG: hypothetical protein U1D06_09675, partial [Paracoccaceae bacterium]|nr:hypothetical protein [Paracoccaceae bacterium]
MTTLAGVVFSAPVHAETRSVTLIVPMTCPAADPIVFERLMKNIPGVSAAKASYADKSLFVEFDDAQTGVEAFLATLADLGVDVDMPQEDMP